MKAKNIQLLMFSMLLVISMGVALVAFLGMAKERFPENITVSENGVTESTLPIRDLQLNPTESREYSVNLVCDATGSYNIYVDYEEKNDGGMKPFIEVTVKLGGEIVYVGSLATLLNTDMVIEMEGELDESEPLVLSFCYLMPYEIGNEAQGTFSEFDTHIKIKKS